VANVTGYDRALALVDTPQDQGFHLTTGIGMSFDRKTTNLSSLDSFEIDLTFRQDDANGKGGLIGLHTVMQLSIEANGSLSFKLNTDEGNFNIRTAADVMRNTEWHDISVRYDDASSSLSIIVDGETLASGSASGMTKAVLSWPMALGRPWGENAKGVFEDVSMNIPVGPEKAVADDADTFVFTTAEPVLVNAMAVDALTQVDAFLYGASSDLDQNSLKAESDVYAAMGGDDIVQPSSFIDTLNGDQGWS
jgi:hypothetical protein